MVHHEKFFVKRVGAIV